MCAIQSANQVGAQCTKSCRHSHVASINIRIKQQNWECDLDQGMVVDSRLAELSVSHTADHLRF